MVIHTGFHTINTNIFPQLPSSKVTRLFPRLISSNVAKERRSKQDPTTHCTNSILFVDFRFQNRNVHGSNVVCSSLVKRCVPARYQMRELEHWKLVAIGNEISDNRWLCAGQFLGNDLSDILQPSPLSLPLSLFYSSLGTWVHYAIC